MDKIKIGKDIKLLRQIQRQMALPRLSKSVRASEKAKPLRRNSSTQAKQKLSVSGTK